MSILCLRNEGDERGRQTSSNAQPRDKVVCNGPNDSLSMKRDPERLDEAVQGHYQNEPKAEPADMLMPVFPGHWGIRDMGLGERISLEMHDAAIVFIVVYFRCI